MVSLAVDLRDGEVLDVGMRHYGEFIVAPRYAAELLNGGMRTVDGQPGTLHVVERYANAVHLKWDFQAAA